jgi:exonuclease VII small subunit
MNELVSKIEHELHRIEASITYWRDGLFSHRELAEWLKEWTNNIEILIHEERPSSASHPSSSQRKRTAHPSPTAENG